MLTVINVYLAIGAIIGCFVTLICIYNEEEIGLDLFEIACLGIITCGAWPIALILAYHVANK